MRAEIVIQLHCTNVAVQLCTQKVRITPFCQLLFPDPSKRTSRKTSPHLCNPPPRPLLPSSSHQLFTSRPPPPPLPPVSLSHPPPSPMSLLENISPAPSSCSPSNTLSAVSSASTGKSGRFSKLKKKRKATGDCAANGVVLQEKGQDTQAIDVMDDEEEEVVGVVKKRGKGKVVIDDGSEEEVEVSERMDTRAHTTVTHN